MKYLKTPIAFVAGLASTATVVGSLLLAGPASADITPAVEQYIPGVVAEVEPTDAAWCADTGVTGTLWWTESEIKGHEIGGHASVYNGCGEVHPITSKSRFRSFHLCNNSGFCGREVYL